MKTSLSILAASVLSSLAVAEVHVVAQSGGDFASIQAAVNAAVDGDTIVVRAGTFAGFTIQGKSLAVAGDGDVVVTQPIVVRALAAAQSCSLSGLRNSAASGGGLRVELVEGAVRVVQCELRAGVSWGEGLAAASITSSSGNVAFAHCTLVGGAAGVPYDDFDPGFFGGVGLLVVGGRAAVHDSTITGGRGGDATYSAAGRGGSAIEFRPSSFAGSGLFVCGSTLTGGRGGDSYEDTQAEFTMPGDGGVGVWLHAGNVAQVRDCVVAGGAPGVGIFCIPPWPPSAGPATFGAGAFYTLLAPRVVLEAPSLVREGSTANLRVRGIAGETAYLDWGRAPSFQPLPSAGGIKLVSTPVPSRVQILGTIPASGELDVALDFPLHGVTFTAHQRYLQAFTRDTGGVTTLGGFAVVSVVDAAY